jgi:hypothetical protein
MKRQDTNAAIFVLILIILGAVNFFNPVRPTMSQYENRALHPKPVFSLGALFNGSYFRDYEEYFADTFVWREQLVKLSSAIKALRGVPTGVELVNQTGDNTADSDGADQPTDGMIGQLLVVGDQAMSVHHFSPEAAAYYADTLALFADQLDSAVHVYSLVAPTQIAFLNDSRFSGLSSPQPETLAAVASALAAGITPVDVYSILAEHQDEYLYFRTDHHWTALGAYYAYVAFMQATGQQPVPLDQFDVSQVDGFLGSAHSTTLNKNMENHPDTLYIYHPPVDYQYQVYYSTTGKKAQLFDMGQAQNKNKYGIFLGGDLPMSKIVSNVNNGRKVLVLKDSFGNAFAPFLACNYQSVYVVDPRHFKQDIFQLIKDEGIQDVIFVNNISVTEHHGFADIIRGMMDWAKGE